MALRRVALSSFVSLALASIAGAAHGGCGGDDTASAPSPDAALDSPADAATDAAAPDVVEGGRAFNLAASGAQFNVKRRPFSAGLGAANLAEDVDLFAVHQDFYGIPWDAFENGTPPPASWAATMDGIAEDAKAAGKGVFLSLTPLDGSRATLAPRVAADGSSASGWAGACYDFRAAPDGAAKRTAYVRYVEWMIDRFTPAYLAIGIEVNLFDEQCPAAWEGLVDVLDAAYDAAKAKSPSVVAFPTLEVGHVMGYAKEFCPDPSLREGCYDASYARLARLSRDRFAISTYPYLQGLTNVADIPADWLSRAAERGGERAVVAETGWLSTPIVVEGQPGQCGTAITFSATDARAWLDRVLDARKTQNMDLVTWISDRDVLDGRLMTDCPCTFDVDWCALRDVYRDGGGDAAFPEGGTPPWVAGELNLKSFGAMGLRAYDGTPKPLLLDRWHAP